jgi:flavin reductase (DIM6/NTAB) family NADH-FMN oxidoreductase RutF
MTASNVEQQLSAEEFKHAFRHHPAGVAIVTADAGDGPVAMTVSSVASVAINPPTLIFSASAMSSSTPTIRRAATVVVHLLASDQVELAKLGATSGVERFGASVEWGRLPTGEPYYPNANAWLRGRVVDRVDVHGSTLVVVEALEAKPAAEGPEDAPDPLVYHDRKWYVLNEKAELPRAVVPYYVVYGRDD